MQRIFQEDVSCGDRWTPRRYLGGNSLLRHDVPHRWAGFITIQRASTVPDCHGRRKWNVDRTATLPRCQGGHQPSNVGMGFTLATGNWQTRWCAPPVLDWTGKTASEGEVPNPIGRRNPRTSLAFAVQLPNLFPDFFAVWRLMICDSRRARNCQS
ncbi:hypothetical protein BCV70DRAFT_32318 [Testicularia cyperi]|uniref:Uncharacterized protein n=1 Tax=Testicularia cyperi TaxID=1882483 RepID=A0A317XJG6_9BASI|nr:hypothetical protein BCV70DRAFT_32318 [Testicularia cyperi]